MLWLVDADGWIRDRVIDCTGMIHDTYWSKGPKCRMRIRYFFIEMMIDFLSIIFGANFRLNYSQSDGVISWKRNKKCPDFRLIHGHCWSSHCAGKESPWNICLLLHSVFMSTIQRVDCAIVPRVSEGYLQSESGINFYLYSLTSISSCYVRV